MTGNDYGSRDGGDRQTPAGGDQSPEPLEEPAVDRVTLARRLRTVERALSGAGDVEFDPGPADTRDVEAVAGRLDTVETRLDAVSSAVRAVGQCLVARDRARRTDHGVESVRRALDALPEPTGGANGAARGDRPDGERDTVADAAPERPETRTVPDGGGPSVAGESAVEWLDRVAAGGVTPPPVE